MATYNYDWVRKWENIGIITNEREIQLRNWLKENLSVFKGKTVMEAGCGDGANSGLALKHGAKKITLLDYDPRPLAIAKKKINSKKAKFVKVDLVNDNIPGKYDVVMCLGVLHHLEQQRKVLEKLVKTVNKNGKLFVWIYGNYGKTSLMLKLVFGSRAITSRLPFFVNKILAYPLSTTILLSSYIVPLPYLKQIRRFSYEHIYEIVLDQMFPKIAVYYTENMVKRLIDGLPLKYEKDGVNAGWIIKNK